VTEALATTAVSDQVLDILKKAFTQQNDKFSQLERKMTLNARKSGASDLGAVGMEAQRITCIHFMLSARLVPRLGG